MPAGLVGTGDPLGAIDDPRVDEKADAGRLVAAQCAGPDVALDQVFVGRKVVFGERVDLGGPELRFEPFDVDLAITGDADGEWFDPTVGMAQA